MHFEPKPIPIGNPREAEKIIEAELQRLDPPEVGEEWFKQARLVEPCWPVDPRAPVVGPAWVYARGKLSAEQIQEILGAAPGMVVEIWPNAIKPL